MSVPAIDAAAFYPPHVAPSAGPLRFPLNLTKLVSNNLQVIPEAAYREPLAIVRGPPRVAFFTGTEFLKKLLLDHWADFPKGALQVEVLAPLFGNAMVSAEGREWRWQRRTAAPMFRHEELLRYAPIVRSAAEALLAKWRAAAPGTIHAIHKDMLHVTFDVMSKTLMAGLTQDMLDALEKGQAEYYSAANWHVLYRLLRLPKWLPRPGGKSMRSYEQTLRGAVTELVRKHRQKAIGGDDLLARLIAATDPETGRSMPDELVVDNILAFLGGGNDTQAFALTWTIYLISQSPVWERRMLDEIAQVVGDGPVTAAHVERLVIVQQVFNESLRLFPTAPLIVREMVKDFDAAGVTVPAGTVGVIPIYAVQRHRSYWDDPDRFDPDRFSPERRSSITRFQFIPFGAGPRICIGAAFVMIQATIMLATFLRAVRFEADPNFDPQPVGRMFLVPRNGMPMRVTLRENAA
jgi:cytochrome P450